MHLTSLLLIRSGLCFLPKRWFSLHLCVVAPKITMSCGSPSLEGRCKCSREAWALSKACSICSSCVTYLLYYIHVHIHIITLTTNLAEISIRFPIRIFSSSYWLSSTSSRCLDSSVPTWPFPPLSCSFCPQSMSKIVRLYPKTEMPLFHEYWPILSTCSKYR